MNSLPQVAPTFTVAPVTTKEQYRLGFEAYCAGRSFYEMESIPERRGWLAANDAHAECETTGYLHKMGVR